MKEYKKCNELKNITSDIIKEWNTKIELPIYLVRKLVYFKCPMSDKLISEKECQKCSHNYGEASTREIYCLPNNNKSIGIRSLRKYEKKKKNK